MWKANMETLPENNFMVGNKAKGRISKRVFKAGQILRKTTTSYA